MSDFRRLLGYARPHGGRLALAVLAGGLGALFNAALPALTWVLIDGELGGMPTPDLLERMPALVRELRHLAGLPVYALVVVAFFGKGLFSYLAQYLMSWVGERSVADLRADLGRAMVRQTVGFHAEQPTGGLLSRMTSDADRVLVAMSDKLSDLVKEPLNILALGGYMVLVEPRLALVSMVASPLVVVPIVRLGRRLRKASERSQQRVADLAGTVHEAVRGIRVVKASATEAEEEGRIARAARQVFTANMRAERVMALTPPMMELLAGFGIAAAFFYGRSRIAQGSMTTGEFFSFFVALFMLYQPAKKLSRVQSAFEQAVASARRCFDIIDTPVEVVDRPGAVELGPVKGEVSFERVSFRYHDRWVLEDLSFRLPPGTVTALVGRSGAGKTTIANLLLRFWDVNQGRVTVDGIDVRDLRQASLRRQVGMVAQDVFLFNDTLAANIAYGVPGASEERIREAARLSYADEFIRHLPRGYDTVVGEAGVRLSAGQRQRLSIARALLKDPPILVLDEATSALDAESESLIVQALANLVRGRTTLVIAHRLSTVRRADLILVLEDGRLREQGTHDQLVHMEGGLYNRLAELQAVGEIQE